MFLDDIQRRLGTDSDQPKYFDDTRYVTIDNSEAVVPLIDGIRCLYVRNTGATDIIIDVHGLRTKIKPTEDKSFQDPGGRQLLVYTHAYVGKLFVGQARRYDIHRNPEQ